MNRALFKKQMQESFSWLYMDRKTGKNRTKSGLILYVLLYIMVFGVLGAMFYMMAQTLCEPLVQMGLGWLYFAVMGTVAVVMGVFGSVFNTSAALYQAKDNDLLLALPIPTGKILVMRLSGVYMMGLLYELLVMVPALILWFSCNQPGLAGIFFSLLLPFVLSVFILTLSCILGWVVAMVSGRVKNKSFVTVVLSLGFIGGYYYVYFQAYNILMNFLANADTLAENARSFWNPLYHLGLSAEGNVKSMLLLTAAVAGIFSVVYFTLWHSFLKLATGNRGAAKVRYKETTAKAGNADSALLRKEFRHFAGSSTYMMNCGLGIIFLVVAGIALLLRQELIKETVYGMVGADNTFVALLATAMVCILTTMNDMTAPSVSLEGKNLWLAQVLPVSGWQVLKAKLKMHLILTLLPTAFLVICVEIVFGFDMIYRILFPVIAALFVVLMAELGLAVNLKMPNLNWTSEIVPVKQSVGVMIALFGGWAIVIGFGVQYVVLADFVSPLVYLIAVGVLLLVGTGILLLWLKNRGEKIFAAL